MTHAAALPVRIHAEFLARKVGNPSRMAQEAVRDAQSRNDDGRSFLASLVRQQVQMFDDSRGRQINLVV